MARRNTTCSECGGPMQPGFIVETAGHGIPYDAAYWLEGPMEKIPLLGHLKTSDRQAFYISAYRCKDCGFLKFYAGPDLTPNK